MTSPSGGMHPTTDRISDLLEGILPPDEGRATAEHVNHCSVCLAVRDALVRTHQVLREAGHTPPAIPTDVFTRVESALRAESEARSRTTVVASLAAARERRSVGWKTKVIGVAAALALFGGASAVAIQMLQPDEQLAVEAPSGEETSSAQSKAAPDGVPKPGSYRALTSETFDAGVRALVQEGPKLGDDGPVAAAPDPLAELDPADSACVSRILTQAGADRVLKVTETTLDGDPVILVVADTTEPDTVHGYAIAGCPSESADIVHDQSVTVR